MPSSFFNQKFSHIFQLYSQLKKDSHTIIPQPIIDFGLVIINETLSHNHFLPVIYLKYEF